ncbi:uncharacterized protein [Aristolochia californica]|uniref:uncharacterized protein n=1 Tax=Aristolochia californica TaxID=171875 RepID=UPI0035DDAAA4
MFRQASSRNQRSKGLKVKHAVQICLLLAVCFWLLYQVKHSHDKKKAFDENNAKNSENLQHRQEILKFGRKDLNERGEVSSSEIEKHHVEVENEEEDENKHEEAEDEGREDEGRGGGDDEIDEHDQEKSNGGSERQEDFVDEEKDEEEIKVKEGIEEEENSEKQENEEEEENRENEEGEENKEISENEDNEERKENSHEAREAQYNGDDASSAVVKESVTLEGENVDLGTSEDEQRDNPEKDEPRDNPEKDEQRDNPEKDSGEVDSKINATLGSSFDQNGSNTSSIMEVIEKPDNPERDSVDSVSKVTATVDSSFDQNGSNTSSIMEIVDKPTENGTDTKEKVGDVGLSVMGNGTLTNPTLENEVDNVTLSNSTLENEVDNVTLSNSTLENEEKGGEAKLLSQGNSTLSHSPTESTGQVLLENLGNETTTVWPDQHQNTTLGTETTTDLEDPNRQSVSLGQTEGEDEGQVENTNTLTGTGNRPNENSTDARGESEDKNPISSILDENSVETTDTNSSVVTQEVKETLTDLGTLPETGTERSTENVAAE